MNPAPNRRTLRRYRDADWIRTRCCRLRFPHESARGPTWAERMTTGLLYDHDRVLVLLAIAVGGFASVSALHLAGRMRAARAETQRAWLSRAALSLGVGIWSASSIAMLALRIDL